MNRQQLIPACIFVILLILYSLTLHPFFPVGDSGEYVAVAKSLGVSHSPGAPLYTIFSYIFAAIPVWNLISRISLLSALWATGAVIISYLFLFEVTKDRFASMVTAILLGVSYLFWLYAIFPEILTASICMNLATIYSFAKWERSRKIHFLCITSFTAGLSVSVHYVNFISLITIIVFTILHGKKSLYTVWNIVAALLFFTLGLTPFLGIPFAASHHSIVNWGNVHDIGSFLQFVLRKDYQYIGIGEQNAYPFSQAVKEQLPFWAISMFASVGLTLMFAPFAFFLKRKYWTLFVFINLLLIGPLLVLIDNYPLFSPYPDVAINHMRLMHKIHVFSLPYVVLLIGLGISYVNQRKNSLIRYTALVFLSIGFISTFWTNLQKITSARNTIFQSYGENIITAIYKPTILITGTDDASILNYFLATSPQRTKNIRLITFSMLQHEWYVNELKQRYPDISIPFTSITVGQKLDAFYASNNKKFDIVFAPLDDQAALSVPDTYTYEPFGVIVKLIRRDALPDAHAYTQEDKSVFNRLVGLNEFKNKQYTDDATNEVLMSYARSFTNIALTSKKLGDTETALYFLSQAASIQKSYYPSYEVAASIYIDAKNLPAAAAEYIKLLSVYPHYNAALKNLTAIYYQLGDKQKALHYANEYLRYAATPDELSNAQEMIRELQD